MSGAEGVVLSPKPKLAENESLIPLINIVFLLLIFFMVAGQMSWLGQLQADAPKSNSEKVVDKALLTLAQDAKGDLFIDGRKVMQAQLDEMLLHTESEQTSVNLYIDKHRSAADLDALLSALRTKGFAKVTLFTVAGATVE